MRFTVGTIFRSAFLQENLESIGEGGVKFNLAGESGDEEFVFFGVLKLVGSSFLCVQIVYCGRILSRFIFSFFSISSSNIGSHVAWGI